MQYVGTWQIIEMEMWDEDYFNMEIQAYIRVESSGMGHFQFGLVSGQIDGELTSYQDRERFDFTWEGFDELDPVSGSGWLQLVDKSLLEGWIKFHLGDSSLLRARSVEKLYYNGKVNYSGRSRGEH